MVCIFHVKKYIWKEDCPDFFTTIFQQGYLGVYIFFVVSGFVIPYSMYVKQYTLNKFFRFIAKRTVRIEPPYVLFIIVMFIWTYGIYQWKGWGKPYLYDVKEFLFNITYLAPFFHVKWISRIFWTLAIEFQFYILTGLLYHLLMKNRILRYIIFVSLLGLGFIIPKEYLTVFNLYVYFIVGFQAFLFQIRKINVREYLISIFLLMVFIGIFEIIIVIPFVLFTIAAIRFLNYKTRITDFLGNISYSLYLSHGIAGGAVVLFTIGEFNTAIRFLMAIATSLLIAWIYYYLVERIFLKLSKKIRY